MPMVGCCSLFPKLRGNAPITFRISFRSAPLTQKTRRPVTETRNPIADKKPATKAKSSIASIRSSIGSVFFRCFIVLFCAAGSNPDVGKAPFKALIMPSPVLCWAAHGVAWEPLRVTLPDTGLVRRRTGKNRSHLFWSTIEIYLYYSFFSLVRRVIRLSHETDHEGGYANPLSSDHRSGITPGLRSA